VWLALKKAQSFSWNTTLRGMPVTFGLDTVMGVILVASGCLTIAYVRAASAYAKAVSHALRILTLLGAVAAIVIGLLLFFGLA
jgi:hypothetical protein